MPLGLVTFVVAGLPVHASIVAHLAVRGLIPSGVNAVESIAGALIVAEGRRRGWSITERRSWEKGEAQLL